MKGKRRNGYRKDQRPASLVLDVAAKGKQTKHTALHEWSLRTPQVKSEAKSAKALDIWAVH